MRNASLAFAASLFVAVATVGSPAPASPLPDRAGSAAAVVGRRDFDFLFGQWTVQHRRLKPGTREWISFEGTCITRPLMEGSANVEEHALESPAGAYRAVGLRAFDPKSGQWAIWWLDGRYPHGTMDPPVKGRFANGVGTFESAYQQDGKPMRVRYVWSHVTPTSARWEQATSADGGKTWDANWIMEFTRAQAPPSAAPPDASASGVRDFDFLRGAWRVRHRYLRASTREWIETDGTCTSGALMGGRANLEEHWMDAPAGAYRALGLRSFDPQTGSWAIWWLDGRDPHGAFDPPLKGRFQSGVGTFFGDTTLGDKPARIRFVWSRITSESAQWEQAFSFNGGETWETVWTMEFRRTALASHALFRRPGLRPAGRPRTVGDSERAPQGVGGWEMPTLPEVGGDESLARVLAEVVQERARQDQKHGATLDDQHAPSYWIGLIDRTIAKVEGTALMLNQSGGWAGSPATIKSYRETLLRVAALAVAAIQACDRGAGQRDDT